MSYRKNETSLLNDIVVLFLSVIVIGVFVVDMILHYIKTDPINSSIVIVIFLVIGYILYRCGKSALEYIGHGAGSWILEVIREVKGTSQGTSRKKEEIAKVYEANPDDVNDAIAVLVSFGMKKNEASLKVHSVVMNSEIGEVDTVQKIVKKSLAEVNK